jgi:hypothetical protein
MARWSLRLTLLATILTTTACGAPQATPSEAPGSRQDMPTVTPAPTTLAAVSPTPAPVGRPSHAGEATGGGGMGEAVGVTDHVTIVVTDP